MTAMPWSTFLSAPTADADSPWFPVIDPWAEPALSIAEREGPLNPCASGTRASCAYGTCGGAGGYGCGGCCACLGGCEVAYELEQTAPHVWTGDSA